jgi:hypothetical protein
MLEARTVRLGIEEPSIVLPAATSWTSMNKYNYRIFRRGSVRRDIHTRFSILIADELITDVVQYSSEEREQ